jgi:hypothetical protein
MTAQIHASKIGGLVREALTNVSNPEPPPVLVPEAKTRIFGPVFFIRPSFFWLTGHWRPPALKPLPLGGEEVKGDPGNFPALEETLGNNYYHDGGTGAKTIFSGIGRGLILGGGGRDFRKRKDG